MQFRKAYFPENPLKFSDFWPKTGLISELFARFGIKFRGMAEFPGFSVVRIVCLLMFYIQRRALIAVNTEVSKFF